jgi:hypothetical protein
MACDFSHVTTSSDVLSSATIVRLIHFRYFNTSGFKSILQQLPDTIFRHFAGKPEVTRLFRSRRCIIKNTFELYELCTANEKRKESSKFLKIIIVG